MKRKLFIYVLLIILSVSTIKAEVMWHGNLLPGETFNWKAEKSELRDLDNEEQYDLDAMVGGINVKGGDTEIYINSIPSSEFDYISGSRLDIFISIEGDISLETLSYNSDYSLLILPISVNGTGFFEILFDTQNKNLLENLTNSILDGTDINDNTAIANFTFNNTLSIIYTWDISNGLLLEKRVTASSGLELLVVQGKGSGFSIVTFPISLIPLALMIYIIKIKYRS